MRVEEPEAFHRDNGVLIYVFLSLVTSVSWCHPSALNFLYCRVLNECHFNVPVRKIIHTRIGVEAGVYLTVRNIGDTLF